jgi:hypothetical protein
MNGDKSAIESESMSNVISYAMSSLNDYRENAYMLRLRNLDMLTG